MVKINIAIIAAIMVLFDHMKHDLRCLDEVTTLLSTPRHYLLTANIEWSLQSAYLYYDLNDEKLIRSGKVTGRILDVRHERTSLKIKM